MTRAPIHQQPKVSPALRLLTSYLHEGLLLDLYGTQDEDGYEVNDIAVAGTNVALHELVSVEFLEQLTQWANDHLPTAAELRNQSLKLAQFERRLWLHEYA